MREGLIPTALGTVVTATGTALRLRNMKKRDLKRRNLMPMIEAGVIGLGLAHIILGSIDLAQKKKH
ncbi:asparagine synthase [Alkalithermobacter paradoxus]|uniref:Asparagine synthase n=1 Tax=Alkalithermobacter paradoxus TaxID=29349 RepID=A0A1V4IBJ6_9FIRM|nr:hypothetical protein CLOTH_05070 [[Clostridium] thermoalcaliphilum]